jgi:hypothetical protein
VYWHLERRMCADKISLRISSRQVVSVIFNQQRRSLV